MNAEVKEGRTAATIQGEINALRTLIACRKVWLRKKDNRLKATYTAVSHDTNRMNNMLDELKQELTELQNRQA